MALTARAQARRAQPAARTALVVGLCAFVPAMPVVALAAPAASPAELLVSIAIGPAPTLGNLAAYADAVKPGAGANLTDQLVRTGLAGAVGASSLDGFDPASWTYLLVARVDAAPAVALVGKVSDARTLATSAGTAQVRSRGGWAIVGPGPLVERIGAYALGTIATQRAPGALTATVYMPQILAHYRDQIEAMRSQLLAGMAQQAAGQMAQFMSAYVDGFMSLVHDTEKLVATLEVTPDLGSLDLALVPRPGSRLARFAALQRPTDYALLDRLPETSALMLLGGRLEIGPYRERMVDMMASLYGPLPTKDVIAAMEVLRRTMTGDVAMAMRFAPGSGMTFTQLLGVSSTTAADKGVAALLDLFKNGRTFDTMGVSSTMKSNPDTTEYDGVALRSYDTSYDTSMAPEPQRRAIASILPQSSTRAQVATFDRLTMVVFAPDSLAEAGRAIDAARGKGPHFAAPAIVGQLLASSRARKDSVAMMMDLGGLLPSLTGRAPSGVQPVLLTLGCADHNAHIRIALPATTARTAVNAGKP